MTIEKTITTLETITDDLENEDVDIETSLKKYGEAIKLAGTTLEKLKKAETKLKVLQKDGQKITAVTLDES